MNFRRTGSGLAFFPAGTAFASAACAHPGHGAPEGHAHGLFVALVLIGAVVVSVWICRS